MVGKPLHCAGHDRWPQRARFCDRIAAGAAGCGECSAAGTVGHASRSRACPVSCIMPVAWVMVVRIRTAGFCPGRPRPVDRAAKLAGTANIVMSDARGRSMASPAVLIRADRQSRARPDAARAFSSPTHSVRSTHRRSRHYVANATWPAFTAIHNFHPRESGDHAAWVSAFAGMAVRGGVCSIMPDLPPALCALCVTQGTRNNPGTRLPTLTVW
jgi:hypothetical protein